MSSIFDPLVPAGAYDEFVKSAAPGQRRTANLDGQ
jgi:hypothetical protein